MNRVRFFVDRLFIICVCCAVLCACSNSNERSVNDITVEKSGNTDDLNVSDDRSDVSANDRLTISQPEKYTSQGTAIIENESDIDALYDAIEIIEVDDSTCFSSVGYSEINEIFYCRFIDGGSEYIYLDVPKSVYSELMTADSKGGYYNKHIKPQYDCMKIGK